MSAEQVKPGYKRTEVGVIPEEWQAVRLGDLGTWKGGATPSMAKKEFWENGDIPWASSADVKNQLLTDTEYKITERAIKQSSTALLPANSVLLVTRSGILRRYLPVTKNTKPTAINQDIKAILPGKSIDSDYLLQCLVNSGSKILSSCLKSGTTVESIEYPWLKAFQIAVPLLDEQRKIASILSDTDALLAQLDQLIAKKRDLKQAAMQQLLTGQTRLPGFSGEWEVKRLGDICTLEMGRTPSRANQSYWGQGYKWLSIADLKEKVILESNEEVTELAAKEMRIIPKGTLLMSFKLSIGRLAFAGCDLFTNEAICSFNDLQANANYLYYALSRIDFSLYGKQAVKGYTLNKASLKTVELSLPSTDEQTAIASVLSDMDAELAVLAARRDKTRTLKQGMMQELLTGRIRLV